MALTLYEFPNTRSERVRWMLQELGVPFEAVSVDLATGAHRAPDYLAVNPNGKVPALDHDGVVIFESVAICLYLGDRFPERGLVPRPGTLDRALHDQWMLFCAIELEQPLWRIRRHQRLYPPEKRIPADIPLAREDFAVAAAVLQEGLEQREFIAAGRFSAADILLAYTLWWAGWYKLTVDFPALEAYRDHHLGRAACPEALRAGVANLGGNAS